MKVSIGPYPDGDEQRQVEVLIDDYDVWGMDHTLALIVYPMLKLLKEKKHGAPYTDDSDVPEAIRSTSAKPKENNYDSDEFWFIRWGWIMDELLWTFEQLNDNESDSKFFDHSGVDEFSDLIAQIQQVKYDQEGHELYQQRVSNGLRLFGKYFQCLWS